MATIPFEQVSQDWKIGILKKNAILSEAWKALPGPTYRILVDLDGGEYEPDDEDRPELRNFTECFWLLRTPRYGSQLAAYAILTDDQVKILTLTTE